MILRTPAGVTGRTRDRNENSEPTNAIDQDHPETDSTVAACRHALAAAQHAAAATDTLNLSRLLSEAPRIGVDLVLHLGEVYYGNIGAAQRLDFTVIGRVVNEAARLEGLCDQLGRQLLLSESFAKQCEVPTEHLGNFQLKGVSRPQAVYGLTGNIQMPGDRAV